jgi:hypothetical protein
MLRRMDGPERTEDVTLHLDVEEATGLYNLLVEAEAWPVAAVGPRPFIRRIREALAEQIESPQTGP